MVKKTVIKVSLQDTVESAGHSLRKAIAAGLGGFVKRGPAVKMVRKKGKRRTKKLVFKIGSQDKTNFKAIATRQIVEKIFTSQSTHAQLLIRTALKSVMLGLVGLNANVQVASRSLGVAKPQRQLEQEAFVKFVKSQEGAGEIGLPYPDSSIHDLKLALVSAITVDVKINKRGPRVRFSLDQRKLLQLTPHPNQFERGSSSPFTSWLSLVTGPNFARSGTPGFSLVRVSDLRRTLQSSQSLRGSGNVLKTGLKRIEITENLIRSSRTRGNAGELAAIMMRNRALRGGRSPAEAFGGKTEDYRPSGRFEGFWDQWWMQTKIELEVWSEKVIKAVTKTLLEG
jgi:hypothetical protein